MGQSFDKFFLNFFHFSRLRRRLDTCGRMISGLHRWRHIGGRRFPIRCARPCCLAVAGHNRIGDLDGQIQGNERGNDDHCWPCKNHPHMPKFPPGLSVFLVHEISIVKLAGHQEYRLLDHASRRVHSLDFKVYFMRPWTCSFVR